MSLTPERRCYDGKSEREEPAASTRRRARMRRGGLEGVIHPLHGWGFKGAGCPCPFGGELERGAFPLLMRRSGRSIRLEILSMLSAATVADKKKELTLPPPRTACAQLRRAALRGAAAIPCAPCG